MSGYLLDATLIARLMFASLPHKPAYRLAMDRTNLKFGSLDINILVVVIVLFSINIESFLGCCKLLACT